VHPDKNPSPEARLAFDALNAAQRHLLDHNNRVRPTRAPNERAKR
jgi:DnaJ-class molecular chaperone